MLNVREMTFEEFIEFAEKKTVSKIDSQVKELVKIIFDNLKSGAWSEDDLHDITDALKAEINQRGKRRA